MATNPEAEPHHGVHLPKKFVLVAAAAGLAAGGGLWALLPRAGESDVPTTENNPVSDSFKPDKLNYPGVAVVPLPTSTPEPPEIKPTPTSSPTPEAVKEQPCLILPEKYCSQAERIQINRNEITETYLAFKLPPGVPFFAPEDGRLLDKVEESGDPFSGLSAILRKPNPPGGAYIFIGVEFNNMLQVKNPKQGSIIGHSNSKGITNHGADVLVTKTKRTPGGPVTDEDALRELFPEAYKKPVGRIIAHDGPGKPTISISYDPNPPQ